MGDGPLYKTIIVEDKEYLIDCERFASGSIFFRNLFAAGYVESKRDKIVLQDLTTDVFDCVYHLLAEGEIRFRYWYAAPVYAACQYLGVKDELVEEIANFIKTNLVRLPEGGILDILIYLWKHYDSKLRDEVLIFVKQNVHKFYEVEEFAELPVELVEELVSQANNMITDEKILLKAVSKWLAKEPSRQVYTERLFRTLLPHCVETNSPELADWSSEEICNHIESSLLTLNATKPYKSWINKEKDPLYVSNVNGRISLHHFDGDVWSELNKPMIYIAKTEKFQVHAARYKANLFVVTPNGYQDRCSFMHFNMGTCKITSLREANFRVNEGIFWMNDKLYACNNHIIQRYCPQYDIWLKPSTMNIIHMSMFASDGKFLYTHALADQKGWAKDLYLYDDRCRNWNRLTTTTRLDEFYCTGFINDELYAADKVCIEKFDVRAAKWHHVMPIDPRLIDDKLCAPKNLMQFQDNVVVLNTRNSAFVAEVKSGRLVKFIESDWYHTLNPVHYLD